MEEITTPLENLESQVTAQGEKSPETPGDSNEAQSAPPSGGEVSLETLEVEPEVKSPRKNTRSKSAPKEKQSKESIEASIREKLSKRSDEGEVDPFVPSSQLENEVKQVAKESGFPLTRGTEAGAALMARARRRSNS
jgi:hypothetical protein